jgi:hypothetical protein
MRLNAVSENLQISKLFGLRKHWRLFEYARSLKHQRNLITHRYGLAGVRFDWSNVWHNVIPKVENQLLVELTKVIQTEEKGGNQKSTNQTSDSLDTLSSQESSQTKSTQSMDSDGSED